MSQVLLTKQKTIIVLSLLLTLYTVSGVLYIQTLARTMADAMLFLHIYDLTPNLNGLSLLYTMYNQTTNHTEPWDH